ncbi:MAG: EamA family transporter, partial [Actinobacteria bacterium]|nr:EamA family transporter [Actinomycetota bacterium]
GWSPGAAVLTRVAVAALLLTVPAVAQLRGRWRLLRRAAGRVAAYGLVAVAGCQLFYFNAIQRIPIGVAMLLEYLGAVLVVGWLWLRHGQRPRRLTVAGAVTAVAGLALVLDLTGPARIDPVGVMWGLLAAAGLAIYFLLSAHGGEPAGRGEPVAGRGESAQDGAEAGAAGPLPPVVMAWAGMCVGAAALGAAAGIGVLPMAASAADVAFLGHRVSWLLPAAGLSLVAAVIAYVTGIGAARRLGAKVASFIGMAEVLFAIAFAWLLLGQLPSVLQFAGGGLILAGVTLVRVDELRGAPAPAPAARPAQGPGQLRAEAVQSGSR